MSLFKNLGTGYSASPVTGKPAEIKPGKAVTFSVAAGVPKRGRAKQDPMAAAIMKLGVEMVKTLQTLKLPHIEFWTRGADSQATQPVLADDPSIPLTVHRNADGISVKDADGRDYGPDEILFVTADGSQYTVAGIEPREAYSEGDYLEVTDTPEVLNALSNGLTKFNAATGKQLRMVMESQSWDGDMTRIQTQTKRIFRVK